MLALTEASEQLVELVRSGRFRLNAATSDHLHRYVGQAEVLEAGTRRGEGTIGYTGGATVNLRGGGRYTGYDVEDAREAARVIEERLATDPHPVSRAINYAAAASYAQFYGDANKRTARYMMNGELLRHGFDAIEVPIREAETYHESLAETFRTGRLEPYARFLLDLAKRQR